MMRFRTPGCGRCYRAGGTKDYPCDNPDPNHGGIWEEVTSLRGMGREATPTAPALPKKSVGDAFYAALRRYRERGDKT